MDCEERHFVDFASNVLPENEMKADKYTKLTTIALNGDEMFYRLPQAKDWKPEYYGSAHSVQVVSAEKNMNLNFRACFNGKYKEDTV